MCIAEEGGLLQDVVLALLVKEPSHGYDLRMRLAAALGPLPPRRARPQHRTRLTDPFTGAADRVRDRQCSCTLVPEVVTGSPDGSHIRRSAR
jgi:hypothetical protein